jgi:hypothetical protein
MSIPTHPCACLDPRLRDRRSGTGLTVRPGQPDTTKRSPAAAAAGLVTGRRDAPPSGPLNCCRHGCRSALAFRGLAVGSLVVMTTLASPVGVRLAAAAVPRFSLPLEQRVGVDPVGMVAGDLNRDGKADLATVDLQSATVSVLLGRGDGSFRKRTAYKTERYPSGITHGDVDGDGDLDLITASIDNAGSISVFSNRGAGRFKRLGTYASGRKAFAVAAADVNHDGRVDLLTANDSREEFAVLLGTGAGRFTVAHRYTGSGTTDVAVGDLNGDGNLDVAHGTTYHASSVAVRLGVGDGTFAPAAAYKSGADTYAVTLADMNHDHELDIAAANYGNSSVSVLLGAGDGSLGPRTRYGMGLPSEETEQGFVDAVVVADFDRDGHSDVATSGYRKASVRRGRGDGTLLRRHRIDLGDAAGAMGGADVADFNRDGWPDLALTESCAHGEDRCGPNGALVFLNRTARRRNPAVSLITRRPLHAGARDLRDSACRLGSVRRARAQGTPRTRGPAAPSPRRGSGKPCPRGHRRQPPTRVAADKQPKHRPGRSTLALVRSPWQR